MMWSWRYLNKDCWRKIAITLTTDCFDRFLGGWSVVIHFHPLGDTLEARTLVGDAAFGFF